MSDQLLRDIPDGPTVKPCLAELQSLPELVESNTDALAKFGAVLLQPPSEWCGPELRMRERARFTPRTQTLPWELLTKNARGMTEVNEFEENARSVSLAEYRKKASASGKHLAKYLGEQRSVDSMETLFWKLMRGEQGDSHVLSYGIDIEVPIGEGDNHSEDGESDRTSSDDASGTGASDSGESVHIPAEDGEEAEWKPPPMSPVGVRRSSRRKLPPAKRAKTSRRKSARISAGAGARVVGRQITRNEVVEETVLDCGKEEDEQSETLIKFSANTESHSLESSHGERFRLETPFDGSDSDSDFSDHISVPGDHGGGPVRKRCHRRRVQVSAVSLKRARTVGSYGKCHNIADVGTVNRYGVLRHLPVMPGITSSMFYVGSLCTRFCWHVEDGNLCSIAYLHLGSAPKVWYVVPTGHADALETFAAKKFGPAVREKHSAAYLLKFKTAMFHPGELCAAGIKVCRFVQNPGTFIVTAPRAYHSGFNCGLNVSEAVNFATPSWLPMGRLAAAEARLDARHLIVPHELILYREAVALEEQVSTSGKEKGVPIGLTPKHAAVIAFELWRALSGGECAARRYQRNHGARILPWSKVLDLAVRLEVSPEFGENAGILCEVCQYTCHFYVAICFDCIGGEKARCSKHFMRACRRPGHETVVVRRHSRRRLFHMIQVAEIVAGIDVSPQDNLARLRLLCPPIQRSRTSHP